MEGVGEGGSGGIDRDRGTQTQLDSLRRECRRTY